MVSMQEVIYSNFKVVLRPPIRSFLNLNIGTRILFFQQSSISAFYPHAHVLRSTYSFLQMASEILNPLYMPMHTHMCDHNIPSVTHCNLH